MTLAELAVMDWTRLIRGIAEAGARAAQDPGSPSQAPVAAQAMADRMLVRAAREGAQVLAWAGTPLAIARVTRGAGGRARAQFVERAELATAPAEVPVTFAQVHRAFAGDPDRAPALVAMFIDAGRRAETLVEQLELAAAAAANAPSALAAATALRRALPRAHLLPLSPRVRSLADFDRMRATGYVDGEPGASPGSAGARSGAKRRAGVIVAEVCRPGLAWHGNVLRKADVIVSESPA